MIVACIRSVVVFGIVEFAECFERIFDSPLLRRGIDKRSLEKFGFILQHLDSTLRKPGNVLEERLTGE